MAQKKPGGQGTEPLVERGGQRAPGVHDIGTAAGVAQYAPPGQSTSAVAPACAVARHEEPKRHSPEHALVAKPAVAPNRPEAQAVGTAVPAAHQNPSGHSPSHVLEFSPRAAPYVPAGHGSAVALVEPAGHQNPGWHCPLHKTCAMPAVSPYEPAGHKTHNTLLFAPLALLKRPRGQL